MKQHKITPSGGLLTLMMLAVIFLFSPLSANAIKNGENDQNNRYANSTVFIQESGGKQCSGTLIAPDIVLTAGHCGFHDDHTSSCPNRWVDINAVFQQNITVHLGNDKKSTDYSVTATHWNISGSEDIILLGLENPVPSNIAVPRKVLTESFYYAHPDSISFWEDQDIILSGYGGNHQFRQIKKMKGGQLHCDNLFNQLCVNPSPVEGGDSGGPFYWRDPISGIDLVIGAIKGHGAIVTFGGFLRTGTGHGSTPLGIPLGQWIEGATSAPLQEQLEKQASAEQPIRRLNGYSERLLYNLWSPDNEDNLITSNYDWTVYTAKPRDLASYWEDQQILDGPFAFDSYYIARIEGKVFAPNGDQPPGTVPLFSWWSDDRKDSFSTTKPTWSVSVNNITIDWLGNVINGPIYKGRYQLYRFEGYIFDPKRPQPPGTVPLYSWWSSSLKDNYSTTNTQWAMNPLAIEWKKEELSFNPPRTKTTYRLYRLEGYLPAMECQGRLEPDPVYFW